MVVLANMQNITPVGKLFFRLWQHMSLRRRHQFILLLVLMVINSRIANGPNWDTETTNSFGDCKRIWLPTLLFIGNFYSNYEILVIEVTY